MKIKTSELTGAALDWAVAKCEDRKLRSRIMPLGGRLFLLPQPNGKQGVWYEPSSNWKQGGPIIERGRIAIDFDGHSWCASANDKPRANYGPTPLIAAMRCRVASKLGDEIELPKELT